MMGLYRSLSGLVKLRYTSADISAVLTEIEKRNIPVFAVQSPDMLTLEFYTYQNRYSILSAIAQRRGEQVEEIDRTGLFWPLLAAWKRTFLVAGLLLILAAGIYVPGRILFISVEGNANVPERFILEAATGGGLSFGASRREIRSEQIKNHLLDAVPQLKWAGVNTYGSRAVITVRERDDAEIQEDFSEVRHIVAVQDGIIASCTVTDGTGACSVGQAVKKGDILISGYTDCGLTIRAGIAKGQIMAETSRELAVKTPSDYMIRGLFHKKQVRYSIVLGKKRINFYKGSGISGGSCVKMSMEYVLTLPGGFSLPVSLIKETILSSHLSAHQTTDAQQLLQSFADDYLQSQMVSGTVLKKEETVFQSDGTVILSGNYACIENIGVERDEEIGDFHGKTDGTDRERRSGG